MWTCLARALAHGRGRFLAVLVMAAVLAAAPCGAAPAPSPRGPGEQLTVYLLDVQELARLEHKAVETHQSALKKVAARKMTDPEFLKILTEKVIPPYKRFFNALTKIKTPNAEVLKLHKIYIEAASATLKAFGAQKKAIEKGDAARMEEANKLMARGAERIEVYITTVESLKVKYGLNPAPKGASN